MFSPIIPEKAGCRGDKFKKQKAKGKITTKKAKPNS